MSAPLQVRWGLRVSVRLAAVLVGVVFAFSLPQLASAQHHGGGGPGGGFGGGGGFHGPGGPEGDVDRSRDNPDASPMREGLQLGPPGLRWWDDKHFIKQLRLRPEQQRRMDAIFEQSRPTLLIRLQTLQQERQRMDSLTHAQTLDENALFAEIDRVAQARADLEKANTHLLFQLRNEMDSDQLTRLENR
jgi:hypothetical protein